MHEPCGRWAVEWMLDAEYRLWYVLNPCETVAVGSRSKQEARATRIGGLP
jgi:hypothetical protein